MTAIYAVPTAYSNGGSGVDAIREYLAGAGAGDIKIDELSDGRLALKFYASYAYRTQTAMAWVCDRFGRAEISKRHSVTEGGLSQYSSYRFECSAPVPGWQVSNSGTSILSAEELAALLARLQQIPGVSVNDDGSVLLSPRVAKTIAVGSDGTLTANPPSPIQAAR